MAIKEYSILKGHPVSVNEHKRHGAHYIVSLTDGYRFFSSAINILSADNTEVLYAIKETVPPVCQDSFSKLPYGVTNIKDNELHDLSIDYVRMESEGKKFITREEMTLLPTPNDSNSIDTIHLALHDQIRELLLRCNEDPHSIMFAFGSAYSANGIHDIHMNQGNADNYSSENGIWQDGFILIFVDEVYYSIFIAFQSQSWDTDNNGNPKLH